MSADLELARAVELIELLAKIDARRKAEQANKTKKSLEAA